MPAWTEKTSKLQFNGAVGFTFSAENDETDCKSGNDFHFEWAVGREISQGLMIGVSAQLSSDFWRFRLRSRTWPVKGSVDAIGADISYATMIDTTPFVLNLRHFEELNAERRWDGSQPDHSHEHDPLLTRLHFNS
jgi:hypothetical protein